MATPTADQLHDNVVTYGRACVRITAAAEVLLGRHPAWTERLLLRMVRALYTQRLNRLVAALPAPLAADILAASDEGPGSGPGFSSN